MLQQLYRQIIKMNATDMIDKAKSNQRWNKKAQAELEWLNLTAVVEVIL